MKPEAEIDIVSWILVQSYQWIFQLSPHWYGCTFRSSLSALKIVDELVFGDGSDDPHPAL